MSKFKTVFFTIIIKMLLMSAAFAYIFTQSKSETENIDPFNSTIAIDDTFATSNERRELATNEIYQSRRNIITETVANVSKSVVGINTKEIRQYRSPFSNDPFMRYFFGDGVYNKEIRGLGSGAIISPDGYILTNDHVAGNADQIYVTLTDGTRYTAKLIGSDQVSDIALLKIDAQNLPYIKLGNSEDIIIGEWVIALGNPFGFFNINDKPTVTVGVVSSLGMNLNPLENRYYLNMIQTDAAINNGNSGGPLVNSIGELIGMNTLIYSQSGGSIGVGFAIPINKIKKIVNELKDSGRVDREFWTGLRIQNVDEGIANYYKLNNTNGVIVTHVWDNSPASKAGLTPGDIILRINDYLITDDQLIKGVLQEFRTNQTVTLKVLREGKEINKQMKLEKKND